MTRRSFLVVLLILAMFPADAAEPEWKDLLGDKALDAWRSPPDQWIHAGEAKLDEKNPRKLAAVPGKGVLVNGPGRVRDLVTKETFTDAEAHVEFMVPKGSNSGVKLNGLYEIQILDSYGKKKLTGDDCGGIYPLAEEKPRYHHIDDGVPPPVYACKKPGELQTLELVFRVPRLRKDGRKME